MNLQCVVAVIAVMCCLSATADEVIMQNGDRLSGDVIRLEGDRLTFKTTYAGTLDIDWTQVREIRLDEALAVLLDDETVLEATGVTRDEESLIFSTGETKPPVTMDASRVKVLKPKPWELGKGHTFGGKANLALKDEQGNSEKSELDIDVRLTYRRLYDLFESYWQLEYDTTRGIQSSDNWTGINNYNRLFRSPWYASAFLVFSKDRFADLRLRYMVGPSLGYRFIESKRCNLRAEVGGYYLDDDFYDEQDEHYWGPGWYLDYDQFLWKKRLQLYHRQIGFAGANDTDKYLWRSWTGIRVPLTSGFVSSLEYEVDYDSRPAIEALTTDTTLRLKLGYQW